MSSRITNSILSSNYLRNMNRNMNNMQTLQNQLASGKAINKASDNPYKASRSMQLNGEISYNKQYNENIKDTSNWLDTTDTALSQMGNIFGRIETLLVNAGNGAYGDDERSAIQDEIKEKVNELSQVLNTSFDGSYIFGGTKTNSKPTTVVDGVLQYADKDGNGIGNNGTIAITDTDVQNQLSMDLQVDIAQGVKTTYNKTTVDVLEFTDKSGNTINVSDLLTNIIDNLDSSDQTKINQLSSENLSDIQSVTVNLLKHRSEVGSFQNRMESAQEANETQNYNMTDILSKTEDIDFAEKTMQYSMMQTVYTAALQTSAKILPMTILSYL
ncbi:flagellar hook-associated protein 3 [Clostridium butyricum]|uniref:flagellar hook-associated protein FlgL n=1 Tax=Clostridium butyricum TaxID=1492 RepID=UPI000F52C2F4|nr:flagellar hook-associated protein FlgL [Clostridium butyricum]RQN12320.1 flagellar hook-associated protein 3 [Clostridium butyricum]